MRQRLGLAAALLGDPTLLILDEPANGLDPAGIRWLRSFLEKFAAGGGTVFVSSHVLSEVALFAEEVIVIYRDRLIQQTSVDQLTAGSTVSVRSPDWHRLHRAFLNCGATVTAHADNTLHVAGLSIEDVGQIAAQENAVLHQLTIHTRTVEDVFLELTSTKGNHATAH
jgi:ABC-2 type transport system ATP-binding protein